MGPSNIKKLKFSGAREMLFALSQVARRGSKFFDSILNDCLYLPESDCIKFSNGKKVKVTSSCEYSMSVLEDFGLLDQAKKVILEESGIEI